MIIKKFIFVCKSRETGTCYLSDILYDSSEVQLSMCRLSVNEIDVIDLIPVEVDFSKYENVAEVDSSKYEH